MDESLDKLRRPTSLGDLARLKAQVRTHAEMLDEESLSSPHIDFTLAKSLASALCELIDTSSGFDAEDRALLGAVARYFVLTEDEASDLAVDGLVDDAVAVRFVCEHLGRPDLLADIT